MIGELWDTYWALLVTIYGDAMNIAGLRTALAILTPVLALIAVAVAVGFLRWLGREFRMGWLKAFDEEQYATEKQARDEWWEEREQRTADQIQRLKERQQRLSHRD